MYLNWYLPKETLNTLTVTDHSDSENTEALGEGAGAIDGRAWS